MVRKSNSIFQHLAILKNHDAGATAPQQL